MKKIKPKPFKPPKIVKPSQDVQFVYCLPIEAMLFWQRQMEQYEKERALNRLTARLRGEPVEPEPDYFGGAA